MRELADGSKLSWRPEENIYTMLDASPARSAREAAVSFDRLRRWGLLALDIIVGMRREELIGLQAMLSEEVASTRGWTGIRNLWCHGESIHLGAIYAGDVVGVAAICHFGDGFCEIHKLYVAPTFRRTDIARRLVGKVEDMARERGWEEIGFEISGGSRPFWTRYLGGRPVEPLGEEKFVFRIGG